MNNINSTHVWYEINWPAHLDIKNVNAWLQAWNGSKDSTGTRFVIKADSSSIRHYLILPARRTQSAIGLIHTFIPDIELIKVKPLAVDSKFTAQLTISPVSRLLKTDQPESISYAILSSLANLYTNEAIIIQWALGKRRAPQAFSRQTRSFQAMSWIGALLEAPFKAPQTLLDIYYQSYRSDNGALEDGIFPRVLWIVLDKARKLWLEKLIEPYNKQVEDLFLVGTHEEVLDILST